MRIFARIIVLAVFSVCVLTSSASATCDLVDTSGNLVMSGCTSSANVFLNASSGIYWTGTSGVSIGPSADGLGMLLHGQGGTITLNNANTVIAGVGGASNTTAALEVKNSVPTSLLYVRNDGKVGIGYSGTAITEALQINGAVKVMGTTSTVTPASASFDYFASLFNGARIVSFGPNATTASTFSIILKSSTAATIGSAATKLVIDAAGNVGIGGYLDNQPPSLGTKLDLTGTAVVNGSARRVARFFDDTAMAAGVGGGLDFMGKYNTYAASSDFANIKGVKSNATDGDANGDFVISTSNAGTETEHLRVTSAGNVGINVPNPQSTIDVSGTIHATGAITSDAGIRAVYQDVAEWVPSGRRLPPGTVVTIDAHKNNEVLPSARPYDTSVAGVVSRQPGLTLGVESDSRSLIATTGRVRVHVDATRHPIAAGDLLVTSDKPGFAMFSQPVDLGEIKIHRPGTIIGKALEPLQSGEGEILVLLSLQ